MKTANIKQYREARPVKYFYGLWWKTIGCECVRCNGVGRINHVCGMGACLDDPCPNCDERGWVRRTNRKRSIT